MGGAAIDLLVLGVSHRTAPVAVRERLAIVPETMAEALAELSALPSVREAALLSTCNRVEIYAAVDQDGDRAAQGLAEALARRAGVPSLELAAHLYERRDAEAVAHLFRVASSLDSLVLGEPQILGQTKQALDAAIRHKSAGAILNTCFQRAFRVAKRVRRETEIARNPVSVSSVAIELARQVFGGFDRRHVLVVGAGKMSELAARTLRAHGATLTVTNRTRARADELAEAVRRRGPRLERASGGARRGRHRDRLDGGAAPGADAGDDAQGAARPPRPAALSCSTSPSPATSSRRCGTLDGIYLADIDDLQKVAAEHRDERQTRGGRRRGDRRAGAGAVHQGLARSPAGTDGDGAAGARAGRWRRPRRRACWPRTRASASASESCSPILAEAFAKKLLHAPQMALRNDDADGVPLVVAVQRLFALEVAAPAPLEAEARRAGSACSGRREGQEGGRTLSEAGSIVIGTRGSALARWQAGEVGRLLRAAHPGLEVREQIIVTAGDRAQSGPGRRRWKARAPGSRRSRPRWSRARSTSRCTASRTSPPSSRAGLAIVAVPTRADPRDAIVSRSGAGLDALPAGQPGRHLQPAPRLPAPRRARRPDDRHPARQRRHAAAQDRRGRRRRGRARLGRPRPPRLLGAHRRAARSRRACSPPSARGRWRWRRAPTTRA